MEISNLLNKKILFYCVFHVGMIVLNICVLGLVTLKVVYYYPQHKLDLMVLNIYLVG